MTDSFAFDKRCVEYLGRPEISRENHKVSAQDGGIRGKRMRTEEQEEAEYEGLEKLVDELRARRQDHVAMLNQARQNTSNSANATGEQNVKIILQRFAVPTRNDIEELSRKISKLDRKIDALKQRCDSEESRPHTS